LTVGWHLGKIDFYEYEFIVVEFVVFLLLLSVLGLLELDNRPHIVFDFLFIQLHQKQGLFLDFPVLVAIVP